MLLASELSNIDSIDARLIENKIKSAINTLLKIVEQFTNLVSKI